MAADDMLVTVAEAPDSGLLGACCQGARGALRRHALCGVHRRQQRPRDRRLLARRAATGLSPPAPLARLPLAVVHGRSSAAADGSSRDRMVNYLSLLPGPLHAGAAQLQVGRHGRWRVVPGCRTGQPSCAACTCMRLMLAAQLQQC